MDVICLYDHVVRIAAEAWPRDDPIPLTNRIHVRAYASYGSCDLETGAEWSRWYRTVESHAHDQIGEVHAGGLHFDVDLTRAWIGELNFPFDESFGRTKAVTPISPPAAAAYPGGMCSAQRPST